MKTTRTLALLLIALAGCISTGGFSQLPPRDQAVFHRCTKAIEPARCGDITSDTFEVMCIRQAEAEYAAAPERDEWLVSYGCPPSMVEPGRYVSEGGAR